jgi:lipopolysaccharide export system permease protein
MIFNARLRRVSVLSRYFLARFLIWFVAILFILVLTTSVVDTLLHFDDVLEADADPIGAASRLLLRVPAEFLGPFLIPFAAFAAVLVSVGLAARSFEVLAIKAGGISPLRPVAPVLVAAAALAVLTFVVNDTLAVEAARRIRLAEQGGTDIVFRRGTFWYHRGPVIYNIRDADRESQTLYGVSVFEFDDRGRLARSIHAEQAHVDAEDRWSFRAATLRRFDLADPTAPPRFERLPEVSLQLAAPASPTLLEASAATLSVRELAEYVAARRSEGEETSRARALLHARLVDPASVLLFALLAVPLALRVERSRSLAVAGLRGVGLVAAFWGLHRLGTTLALEGLAPAVATSWAVLLGFLAFGAWRLARVPR